MGPFKTTSLNVSAAATVGTTLSAQGIIYAQGGNSELWNQAYTNVQSNSGSYVLQGGNTTTVPLSVGTNSAQPLILETNGVTRINVGTTGNVGVGATDPLFRLHVIEPGVTPEASAALNGALAGRTIMVQGAGSAYLAGRDVSNDIEFVMGTSASDLCAIVGSITNHPIQLRVNNSTRVHINTSGNVGIGTTSPTAKLHVVGTVLVDGTLTVTDANNIAVGTTTGTKIGTATTQKIGFFNATPVAQQALTTDLLDSIQALGLVASGSGNTPLNLSNGSLSAGNISGSTFVTPSEGNSSQWNSTYTTVLANSASWEESAEILPTVTNYLSTSNILMSAVNVTTDVVANRIQATVKNFYIKHPTKPDKHLVYSSLETPYNGVQLTGEAELINGQCAVELPDYISGLIHPNNIHIQLTNYKHSKTLYVNRIDIKNNKFVVKCDSKTAKSKTLKFFWLLNGVRRDIEELQTEV